MASIVDREKRVEQMLREAATSCEIMKQEAEKQQAVMLHEAEEQAEAIREEARKAGHEEGAAAGRQEGIEQLRQEQHQILVDANERAANLLETANAEKKTYLQQAEQDVVTIAMEVVSKVLPQHFIDVPQVILPLVQKALSKVRDQPELLVHVGSESYDMVLMARAELQSLLEGNAALEIKPDDTLGPGDCVVETPNGNVDARLATQLEQIKKAIQDVMA